MSEQNLSHNAKKAMLHIRNSLMHSGRMPTMRELMDAMHYKSPRSAMLLLMELRQNGFLEKTGKGSYKFVKDLSSNDVARTVSVPLVGIVACGVPMLAKENIEAMIPVSLALAKPGSKYFMLHAKGDSMNLAGINDGDLILVKQQSYAEKGQRIVALIDDEATVKEFHPTGAFVTLLPKSTNPNHKPIIVTQDLQIQGVVVTAIPNVTT